MEKVMWLVQGITIGHARMLRVTQRDHQQRQAPTCWAELGTNKHNHHTRHWRQPFRAALAEGDVCSAREAQRRIRIALPEPVGVGGGSITSARTKVHQAGAIKPGGERSSEPPEGAGSGVGPLRASP